MSLLDRFKQTTGQEVAKEVLRVPPLMVSHEIAPGVFVPHENIFITNCVMADGQNSEDPKTLAITLTKKEKQEDGSMIDVAQSTMYVYNNINATDRWNGDSPFSAEQIYEQMIKYQEFCLHIISAFVPRENVKLNMWENVGVPVETIQEQLTSNNYNAIASYIPSVYKTCSDFVVAYLNHEELKVSELPLKVKLLRQSADKPRPIFPNYLSFYTDPSGKTTDIVNNFISQMSDLAKCNSISYNNYEKGISKGANKPIDRTNPYEKKVNVSPAQSTGKSQAFKAFGAASKPTTEPQTPSENKPNPFAKLG